MIISCFHTIGLNVTCLNLPPQRPLQRDTGFDGDTLFDCQIVHPLNPSIVGIQNILYPLKDQRRDTQFDGDTQFDVTPAL